MFSQLNQIDRSPALSPAMAGEILQLTLQPIVAESDAVLYIFRGSGGLWSEVELRLPRGGNGRQFVLVLKPITPVPMDQVVEHFGKAYAMEAPNPAAGAQAMIGYSYSRPTGKLRFSFPSIEQFAARVVLFDRMG